MRPLIIGQAPGPATDPGLPLSGRSGARLAMLAGLDLEEFLARFERVNVLPRFPGKGGSKGDAFPLSLAKRGAASLREAFDGRTVVLLGKKVSAAFLFDPDPLLRWREELGARIAVSPHPSGISHWWNEPANVRRARQFWRALAREMA